MHNIRMMLIFVQICISTSWASGQDRPFTDAPVARPRTNQAVPQLGIAIDRPETGIVRGPLGTNAQYTPQPGVRGILAYAFVSPANRVSETGNDVFDNFLVLRRLDQSDTPENDIRSFAVHLPPHQVIRQTTLSPDGTWVAISVGQDDPANTFYVLYLFEPATGQIIPVGKPGSQVTGPQRVSWSPDSRYVAYFDGDNTAHERYWPPRLWMFDRQWCTSHLVVSDVNLMQRVSWSPEGRLLYSIYPSAAITPPKRGRIQGVLPGIYSIDPAGREKPIRYIANATQPVISPNGQLVAAFITKSMVVDETPTYRRSLALYPRKGGKPQMLPFIDTSDSALLLWSPNNEHLYTMIEQTAHIAKVSGGYEDHRGLLFQDYNLATKETSLFGSVSGLSNKIFQPETSGLGVLPLRVSADGRYVFIFMARATPNPPQSGHGTAMRFLYALDLATGHLRPLFQVDGYGELDVAV